MRDHDPEFLPPGAKAAPPPDRLAGWVRAHERRLLACAAALQVLVLAGIVVGRTAPWVGASTRTVLLRVVPVDPRDLMRGDYVILSYDVSRLPPGGIPGLTGDPSTWDGRTVYVTLAPEADGRHYVRGAVTADRPASGPFLRGTVAGSGRVVFGIESYYVQEGQGKDYEAAVRDHRLSAEVALTPDGRPALRGLVIE